MDAASIVRPLAIALVAGVLIGGCGGGGGSDSESSTSPPASSGPSLRDPIAYSSGANASLPSGHEAAAITSHTLVSNGHTLGYTASAGHLNAQHPVSGSAQASMFYVAYTLDGQAPAARPLIFFYNGGPGSASVWLHLGSFGPRRVVTNNPSTALPQPFLLVDNTETLLDVADLVFVDAVGTGYSQAVAPSVNGNFWGVDTDAQVMRDFIARYITVNGRGASPVFLFGESYGTTRSAVLANQMVAAGMRLDGVMLQSSVLDYNSNCALFQTPSVSCAGFLPSYGMTGAWFQLLANPPAAGDTFGDGYAQTLRDFTTTSYAPAVATFLQSPGTPPAVPSASTLFGLTGAPVALWNQQFNLPPDPYRSQVLAGRLMGRYDARVAVASSSPLAAGGDPSSSVINAPFVAAQSAVLANELQYSAASSYTMFVDAIATWNFSHDGRALPDTIPDLAAALTQRPSLRVLSLNGYHDLATPFHQTELDLGRLGNAPQVSIKTYPGGHMTYLDDASRPRMKADIVEFVQRSLTP